MLDSTDCLIYINGKNGERYIFDMDDSIAADYLIQKHNFVNIIGLGMLYYHGGMYLDNGKELAEQSIDSEWGSLLNTKNKPLVSLYRKSHIMDILKSRTYAEMYTQISPVKIPFFDSNLDIINMCNGLYNWRTGEFTEHSAGYPSRIQIAAEYDPTATCPTILEIIKDVVKPSDFRKVMEFFGYCFYRSYVIQKAFILWGPAGSGKSQVLKALRNCIGSWNVSGVTLNQLSGRNSDKFATSQLYGKLLNEAGDLDNVSIEMPGVFKQLISGSDLMLAQYKYGKPFEFVNTAKFIFGVNDLMPVNDKSDGFFRRIEPIECDSHFTPSGSDFERLSSLEDPKELSGLFNEVISYLPELLERKAFHNSLKVSEIRSKYLKVSNTIEKFANDCIDDMENEYISKQDLYDAYVKYCEKCKAIPVSKEKFGRDIKKTMDWGSRDEGFRTFKGKGRRCWLNVRVTLL